MINLIHGDCLEEMDKIPDGSIDLVLTDPPYGTTSCKWDTVIPFEPMWEQLKRVTKKNGAIVLFGSQPFTSALVMSNPKMFKYEWVWNKKQTGNPFLAKSQPLKVHENICVFSDKNHHYQPQMRKGVLRKKGGAKRSLLFGGHTTESFNDDYFPISILEEVNDRKNKLHPTQKPVALMEYLIKTYTNEGETVLDFAMGSGTTGVACKNLNRNFIGIELDEAYYNKAKERIEDKTLEP